MTASDIVAGARYEAVGQPSRSGRIAIVEAMRGLASIAVACFHFSVLSSSPIGRFAHAYGWLGVDVFFVISGFVIPLSLHGRDHSARDFPKFLMRRLARLEPPYLLSIALVLAAWQLSTLAPGFSGTPPTYSLPQIGFHFFYLIPLTHYEWLGPTYWSLAYEFVFYIVVGLTFASLASRPSLFTFGVVAAFGAVSLYAQHRFFPASLMVARILEFGVGVLLMRLVVDPPWAKVQSEAWLGLCLVAVFAFGNWAIGIAVLATAAAIYFGKDLRLGRWAYVIGGFSYSLYLTHTIVGGRIENLGRRFGDGALYDTALLIVSLAVSIAFAMVFSRLFEAPFRRLSHRIA
ncbi:MAG: acyltransferase [Proteobacteria bacterium]|nr:acyltransferase [Pseudomonadota bacterium]